MNSNLHLSHCFFTLYLATDTTSDLEDRLHRLENQGKLSAAGLGGDQIDMILSAIDEVKGDLRKEMDKKLDPYVTMNTFGDHLNNHDSLQRKATSTDKALDGTITKQQDMGAMMEANRKASTRNQADIEKIKSLLKQFSGKLASGGSPSGGSSGQEMKLDFDEKNEDGEPGVDSAQLDSLKLLLKQSERTLSLRIEDIEKITSRFGKLQDRVDILEQPKGPLVTDEDVAKWNKANERSLKNEELLNAMRKELNGVDAPKIKADIIQLFRTVSTIIPKDDFDQLKEQTRKMNAQIAENSYEIAQAKDHLSKNGMKIQENQKANQAEFGAVKVKQDNFDSQISAMKKMLQEMNANLQDASKKKYASGGAAAAGGGAFVQELEEQLLRLEKEFAMHVEKSTKEHKQVVHELENKASKDDLASLEARLLSEINELIENLKG